VVTAHRDVLPGRLAEQRVERLLDAADRVAVLVQPAHPVDLAVQLGRDDQGLDDVATQPLARGAGVDERGLS
jgi:hypothetical protein